LRQKKALSSAEKDFRQLGAILFRELVIRSQDLEDLQHRLARPVVAKPSILLHNNQEFFERLLVPFAGGLRLGESEARLQIAGLRRRRRREGQIC